MSSFTTQISAHERRGNFFARIRHYRQLLWRTKWILLFCAVFFLISSSITVLFLTKHGKAEFATVLIGVENTADRTAVKDVSGLMQAQSDMILSRTFLQGIVSDMSLRLTIKKFPRSSIVDSIALDSNTLNGRYRFTLDSDNPGMYWIGYSGNDGEGIVNEIRSHLEKPKEILRGNVSELSVISFGGLRLNFCSSFKANPHNFFFKIIDMQTAVEDLFDKISVKESDSRTGVSNISLSVKGKDYKLAADIANRTADAFVDRNMNFKQARTRNLVSSLEKQLESVSKDLMSTQDALERFRAANPSIGLSENIKQRIGSLSAMEKGAFDSKKALIEGQELQSRFSTQSTDEKQLVGKEILAFLAARNVSAAAALTTEFTELVTERRQLEKNYVAEHPLRIDNATKLGKVLDDINAALTAYLSSTQAQASANAANIASLSNELQTLPSKELQLAELERRHQIFSDIYSSVLNRYNQAKVSNTGEVSEVYVMDRAVPPISPPPMILKLLVIIFFVTLMGTFLPVLALDYFDRTAHTEDDFILKCGKRVFEGIPKLEVLSKVKLRENGHNGHVTVDSLHDSDEITKEVFRVLRTKLMLKIFDAPKKSLVVTSLEPGAGKSTVTANLAFSLAQQRVRTLVIDADLRRGTLYKWFGKPQTPGLSDFLGSFAEVNRDAAMALVHATSVPDLFFVNAGTPQDTSSELLSLHNFEQLLKVYSEKFSLIIIDSPPLEAVIDAAIIAPLIYGFLVIARAGVTDVSELSEKISEFPVIDEKVIGYVLNSLTSEKSSKYFKYSKYYAAMKPEKA